MARIGVIGAAGYLGKVLVDELLTHRHEVIAIGRQNAEIILSGKAVRILQPTQINDSHACEVVINLAYPKASTLREIKKQNKLIAGTIVKLSRPGTKIIHTSSMAVFGMTLDRTIHTGPVKLRPDYPYVVNKQQMEILLAEHFGKGSLDIVRLGNIWGPASENWTKGLADRLLYCQPVGFQKTGFSNVTDVANAASYLRFLAEKESVAGCRYHHLAEFSAINWSFWLYPMSKLLHTEPVVLPYPPPRPKKVMQEMKEVVSALSPASQLGKILRSRYLGFYLRQLISISPRFLKKPLAHNIKTAAGKAAIDTGYLTLISSKVEFRSVTDPNWQPPQDEAASMHRVLAWMKESGYTLN